MTRLKRPFWVALGVFLVVLLFYVNTYDSAILRLLILIGLFITVNLIYGVLSLRGVGVKRNVRIWRLQVGNFFEERFEIDNNALLPKLWLEMCDLGTLPNNSATRVVSGIGGRELRSYIARTLLERRGTFELGPTKLISGDPFGLVETTRTIPGNRSITVLPHFDLLEQFVSPTGMLPGGKALRSKTLETTPYATGIREYQPGDPLSRIHWKATAKTGKMMVKEFEQDMHANVWVLLDANENVRYSKREETQSSPQDHFWLGKIGRKVQLPQDTFEYGVSISASVADYYLRLGKAVGFASAGQGLTVLSPEKGERQIGKLLEILALLKPVGKMELLGLIQGVAANITRGSIVVLVTSAWDREVPIAVEYFLERDLRPVVVNIDPASFGLVRSSNTMLEEVKRLGVPLYLVHSGDVIQLALSRPIN